MNDSIDPTTFRQLVWEFYAAHGRHDLPWRQPEANGRFDAYKILVSEIMLQQTQVRRVLPKFHEFLSRYPTVSALASAPLGEVLKIWSGLGYNRRAKFLWQAAQKITTDFNGVIPSGAVELISLPGVGKNTAGAIMVYAFNEPAVFLETNIRTVYIHHFFHDQIDVSDRAISEVLEQTLDREQPREFYWALMDYGSFLKQTVGNLSKFSKTYTKQSTFQGSHRQIRGQILRLLAEGDHSEAQLAKTIADDRLTEALETLLSESLIQKRGSRFHL